MTFSRAARKPTPSPLSVTQFSRVLCARVHAPFTIIRVEIELKSGFQFPGNWCAARCRIVWQRDDCNTGNGHACLITVATTAVINTHSAKPASVTYHEQVIYIQQH